MGDQVKDAELHKSRTCLVRALSLVEQKKLDGALTGLMESPELEGRLRKNSSLREVLRVGLRKDVIPEDVEQNQALELVDKAIVAGQVSDKLVEARPETGPGRPPKVAALMQKRLLDLARCHEEASELLSDETFTTYLKKMGLAAFRLGFTAEGVGGDSNLAAGLLDHITTEYQLMRKLKVPPSIIRRYGHVWTVFEADDLYREAKQQFGADKESETLVRTAALQCFTKQYPSMESAKTAYDERLQEEKRRLRITQFRELEIPDIHGKERDEILESFSQHIRQIGVNFSRSRLGREDAMQVARLTILEALQEGGKNPEKIVDSIIATVLREAASEAAFGKLTLPLKDER